MFLALDVGNTQTTYGLIADKTEDSASPISDCDALQQCEGAVPQQSGSGSGKRRDGTNPLPQEEVVKLWRTQTFKNDTADELAIKLHELFACSPYSLEDVDAVGVSCVVPSLFHAWTTALDRLNLKGDLIRATDYLSSGLIAPDIAAPETIGADRLANAAEAKRTYGSPAIVVDFGTATNIDVVDNQGYFVGGSISPGLMLSASALFERAGMLSDTPIQMPAHAIGTTSEENLQAGLVLGWAGMVDGLVARIKDELGLDENAQCAVIGTGGLMSLMSEAAHCFTHLDADLTIRGIRYLYDLKHS